MSESTRMMLGLVIGIAIMIVLVMKTKVHTFIALLLAALITGLIGGMPVADITNAAGETTVGVMTAIKDGFGNTLKSTGIIIGLGVMMGGILEVSGAAEQLAFTFIRVIGKRKEEWALAITGWVVSIPVFADSAIVIFAPLVKAMSSVTGISVVGLALSLACGLQLTHCLVPPTPGPLTAAGMLGVDVGQMIMVGAGISIPMLIVVVFYCKYIGKEVARKAALGLDMRVISYVPRPEGKDIPEYIEIVSWEELLQTSDYISLHVPGGEKNQGIISKKEFAMMKKSASLIQVSRGGVVDEEALAEAIRNSQIRGAAVDVFSEEPPQKDNPLLKLEQVILTPHIGSNTVECMDRIALDVAEDVHLVLSGENPKHPIKR